MGLDATRESQWWSATSSTSDPIWWVVCALSLVTGMTLSRVVDRWESRGVPERSVLVSRRGHRAGIVL